MKNCHRRSCWNFCSGSDAAADLSYMVFTEIQGDTKRELLKNPTKIEEIEEKKFIDRN